MRLEAVFWADHADNYGGSLGVLGGVRDYVPCAAFPCRWTTRVVVIVDATDEEFQIEQPDKVVQVLLFGPNGQLVENGARHRAIGSWEVKPRIQNFWILEVGIEFTRAGRWQLAIDYGEDQRVQTFIEAADLRADA